MNRANWKDGAELIGIGAIVLSLIFVGFQIKQSHEIAFAAQYQARLDTWAGVLAAYIQSDVALRVVGEPYCVVCRCQTGSIRSNGKSGMMIRRWKRLAINALSSANPVKSRVDNIYFQYQSGFLDRRGLARIPT